VKESEMLESLKAKGVQVTPLEAYFPTPNV
jgi:hypothetical protein